MNWEVEYTDEFGAWWAALDEKEQIALAVTVGLLERMGPNLPFPHSSALSGSRHGHLRELRSQCGGRPLRTLYAFDPRRVAILLIGGDKTGDDRWYDVFIPIADALYDRHLMEIAKERGDD
ncbi:type II toxin-antitoxin system RelE/ParE family toxin [Synergistaceae bacterium OttesenSCG-928-I11]|nr:type II toxin-antitoxin system RelE/ParE family toxin [Synergistaceae bacterium OttesenSCG-928-I11]